MNKKDPHSSSILETIDLLSFGNRGIAKKKDVLVYQFIY